MAYLDLPGLSRLLSKLNGEFEAKANKAETTTALSERYTKAQADDRFAKSVNGIEQIDGNITLPVATPTDISAAVAAHDESDTAHAALFADKANNPTSTTITLPAAAWQGDGPYTQTLTIPGVTADTVWFYDVVNEATTEQWEQFDDAIIRDATPSGANAVTFIARGDVPTIDLPLKIVITGAVE